jgi:MarR family transcriptional regulator, transcriptional regulator for hemolysin
MDQRANFGFLLKDISRLYSRNFERHAAGHGLTLDQCRVLGHLSRHEGICQARLAYLVDMDPMTLGRLLARMEANGLIERRSVRGDRRVRALHLCKPSGPVLETIWMLRDLAHDEALAGLGPRQQAQLMAAMDRIHRNLAALLPGIADEGGRAPAAARGRSPAKNTRARR